MSCKSEIDPCKHRRVGQADRQTDRQMAFSFIVDHARIFSVLSYQNLSPRFLTFCGGERLIPAHFLNFIILAEIQFLQ